MSNKSRQQLRDVASRLGAAMQIVAEDTRCEHCKGRTLVRAEDQGKLTPEVHCTCPTGPLWPTLLATDFGTLLRLAEAQRIYRNMLLPGQIAYYNPGEDQYCRLPAVNFREAVQQFYQSQEEDAGAT